MDSLVENVRLDDVEKRILSHFEEVPQQRSHTSEIAEHVGITRHTASKYLSVLSARGIVGHEQIGNAKVWYPIANEVDIRSLEIDDLDEIVSVAERIPAIQGDDDVTNLRREVRSQLADSNEFCVGAVTDRGLVGFVVSDRSAWEFGSSVDVGWIRILGVLPEYQGKGVGRLLATELFQRFRSAGVERIRTIVGWEQSDVLPFFHELGFNMTESTVLEHDIETEEER